MHQIRSRLGLRFTHRWGNSQRFPRSLIWILRGSICKGKEKKKKEGMGREEKGKREKGKKGKRQKGKSGKGKVDEAPQLKFLATPLSK